MEERYIVDIDKSDSNSGGDSGKKPANKSFWKGMITGALIVALIGAGIHFWPSAMDHDGKMDALENLVESQFLYGDDVNEKDLQEGTYKGYMQALGDPYSVYYTPEEFEAFENATISGEFYGIGAVFIQDASTGQIMVNNVYEDSPAQKAGISQGDILLAVNGKEIDGRDLNAITSDIKGEKGTEVELTFKSGKTGEEYTKTLKREKITVQTVSGSMMDDGIAYIKISEFTNETYDQFEEVFSKLDKQGMKGLVIDLRDNTGGVVSSTCEILDQLLPEGRIVYTKDKNGNIKEQTSDAEHYFDKPLALLVNGYTASASEIFTAAIQDYGLGSVVGTKTFGKGIVQQLFSLPDGSGIKLTVSEYFSPKDREIHEKGLEPDVEVKDTRESLDDTNDAQLQQAIKEVREDM